MWPDERPPLLVPSDGGLSQNNIRRAVVAHTLNPSTGQSLHLCQGGVSSGC